jgi:hypothetical protein
MRRIYGQGRAMTLAKFTALGAAYLISASLMLALTVLYSFATL